MDPRPADPTSEPADPPPVTAATRAEGETNPHNAPRAGGPPYPFLSPPERPGELGRLGPYRVFAELGRGGMGAVFRAEEVALKRQVALKVMLPEGAADPLAQARFRREAQAQAQVEHENVAVIHNVGEANGVLFLAMPLLKGHPLSAALKINPRPPLLEVIRIAREIAEGLAAAHAVGLVHRDIKPGNIWLEAPKRRVKILDFGLVRADPAAAPDEGEPLTERGAILGTPAYMSPEQATGARVDHRSDLFALGAVLYQMATGRMPFTGRNTFSVMLAVTTHHPPAAHEVAPDLPPALSDVIARLLAKDPAARPQTAGAVVAELESIESGLSMPLVRVLPLSSLADGPLGPDPWTDLDATESTAPVPEELEPDPAARLPGATRQVLLWAVLGLLVLAGGAALAVVLVTGSKGRLIVEADDPNWEVVVTQGGRVVRDRTRDREFALPPGEYAVEPVDPPPGLKVSRSRVALANGGRERVRLWIEKKPVVKPADRPAPDPGGPAPTAENRRALERVLAVGGKLTLLVDGKEVPVPPGGPLPAGPFAVRDLILDDVLGLDESALEVLRAVPPVERRLGLARTGIADTAIAKVFLFLGLGHLTALDLEGTSVTDAALDHLTGAPNLTWLGLKSTAVSAAGVTALAEKRPGCTIEWDGGVIEPKESVLERKAAEVLNPHAKLVLALASGPRATVAKGAALPAEAFVVTEVWFEAGQRLPPGAAEDTFFPAVARLRSVAVIYGWNALVLTDEQIERLSKLPLAKTLTALNVAFELTPRALDALRRFPNLTSLQCYAQSADNARLARLVKELPNLSYLILDFGNRGQVSARGLDVLARLPLRVLGIAATVVVDGAFVRLLPAKPGLRELMFWGSSVGDDDLKELRKCESAFVLILTGTQVTDAGLAHLKEMSGLRVLHLQETRVTGAGVENLAAALLECQITWAGGVIEPSKKP